MVHFAAGPEGEPPRLTALEVEGWANTSHVATPADATATRRERSASRAFVLT